MTTSIRSPYQSIKGLFLGIGAQLQLVSKHVGETIVPITNNAVDAVITFSGNPTSGFGISVQLNNADGTPIAHCQPIALRVVKDANGSVLADTGGSTGIAIGAAGKIDKTVTAKLLFAAVTDITGLLSLTWTDTAHEVAYLGVVLPNGRTVYSAALTTA